MLLGIWVLVQRLKTEDERPSRQLSSLAALDPLNIPVTEKFSNQEEERKEDFKKFIFKVKEM